MIRLMYFSTAAREMSQQDVSQLVKAAAARNARKGVTGMLAFNGRNFCQILEGEDATVRDLVEVIRADTRHAGFKVLGQKTIAQRYFDGWSLRRVEALDFSEALSAMEA